MLAAGASQEAPGLIAAHVGLLLISMFVEMGSLTLFGLIPLGDSPAIVFLQRL